MPLPGSRIFSDCFNKVAGDDHESTAEPSSNDNKGCVELNDDCLLYILKFLNFNDKTTCRLVSQQFRRLVDGMTVTKLVSLL